MVTLELAGLGVGAGVSAHWEFSGGSGGTWARKAVGGEHREVGEGGATGLPEPAHTAPAGDERHCKAEPAWCAGPGQGGLS